MEIAFSEIRLWILFFLFSSVFTASADSSRLVVADFNSGNKPNNLGQDWGSWNYDPKDPDQGAYESLEPDDFQSPSSGHCLRIDYDVQSQKPAFNGFWMKLGGLDATPYQWLSFRIRGDRSGRFTNRFKLELKNQKGERAIYLVRDITLEWREIRIPFRRSAEITDWSRLTEWTMVLDDILATYKEGTLYLDQIEFQK